jgi:hypothetical protein
MLTLPDNVFRSTISEGKGFVKGPAEGILHLIISQAVDNGVQ